MHRYHSKVPAQALMLIMEENGLYPNDVMINKDESECLIKEEYVSKVLDQIIGR